MATPTFSNRYVYAISDASRGVGSGAPVGTIPLGTPHVRIPNDEGNGGWVETYEDLGTAMTQAALESAIAGQGRGVDLTLFQNLTIPGSPPPGGSSDLTPNFEFDFGDFADLTAVEADADHVFTFGTVTLESESSAPWADGGASKYIRAHFPGGAVEEQHGMDLNIPTAARDREIAFETYIKYGDWIDGCSVGSTPCDHKTVFLTMDADGHRHSYQARNANANHDWWGDINQDPDIVSFNGSSVDPVTEWWDGTWHRFRVHVKQPFTGETNGIRKVWIDDVVITDNTGFGTGSVTPTVSSSRVFSKISLSRNGDPGGTNPVIEFGRCRVWKANNLPSWAS